MDTYCKVLIVDDEMLVRQGIKHLFDWESEGFTIVGEATNGREALEQIPQLQPDIVLMDIVMPVMDGEELARLIQARYPEVKIIVLSSFSEFEYVRSTFQSGASDYILKPKLDAGELVSILKKAASAIPRLQGAVKHGDRERSVGSALEKLVSGYSLESDTLQELVRSAFTYPSFALLAAERFDRHAAYTSEELQRTVEAELGSLIGSSGISLLFRPLSQEEGRVRLLCNANELLLASLSRLLQQLASRCDEEGVPAVLALSAPLSKLEDLHRAAAEQIPALLEERFFLPEQRVFTAGEESWSKAGDAGYPVKSTEPGESGKNVKPDRSGEPGEPSESSMSVKSGRAGHADHPGEPGNSGEPESGEFDSEAFSRELNQQEFPAAFARLRAYLAQMPGRLDTGMYAFKSLMGHCMFNTILALLRFQYEAEKLEERKYEYFRGIHESPDIYAAAELVEGFLAEAEECLLQRTRSGGNQALKRILDYIQEHYAEPLTLTEIAHHFHFNPSYLSNYFVNHNKEGFSEYLNKVRIEKACELLRQEDATISDISGQVGYSDHSYFTKVFRKQKGVSPSQYRKQLLEGQDQA